METKTIKYALYRGGSSRGLMFTKTDLPDNEVDRDYIFKIGIDCWNGTQVDGVGGGTSSTSKACVVSPSNREGIDVDWTFYQVGVANEIIDAKGSCGNMMAAVGAYAVDEGMISIPEGATVVDITVFNTNINQTLRMKIPVVGKEAKVSGDYHMTGVHHGGENTGAIAPIGDETTIVYEDKDYIVTFSDVINSFIFIPGDSVGLCDNESNAVIRENTYLIDTINSIRDISTVKSGMAKTLDEAVHVHLNNPNQLLYALRLTM